MSDAGAPWTIWSSVIGAATIAISALVGGAAALVGIVWRGGHASAAIAAREQQYADELSGLSTSITRLDALALRVTVIEGQQTMIATTLRDMRSEMAAGFDRLSNRQDRMIETIRNPG